MSADLDAVRSEVGEENCNDSCSRDGCKVDLTSVGADRVIVDADKAFPAHGRTGPRCDFILFANRDSQIQLAVPLELKSGRTKVSEVVEQLQGGADFAACFVSPKFDLLPVLIHGKDLHPRDRRSLNRAKIAFHGCTHTIRTARCDRDRNLARALSE